MRRRTVMMPLAAVLATGLLAGCQRESDEDLSDDAKKRRLKVVSLVKPTMLDLPQTTTQPATVHPFQEAEIHAKVSGYLKELSDRRDENGKVDIGEKVDIGVLVYENNPLAVISVPEMLRAKESQEAEILSLIAIEGRREAEKKLADAQKKSADALAAPAQSLVEKADAHLNADLAERDRVKGLVADMSVARRLLDEAQKRYEASLAAKSAAESGKISAAAQVVVAERMVDVAQSVWDAAKQQTIVARKKLLETGELIKYATLTAPFTGVITERNVDKGDLVRNMQTAAEPLFVVADISQVRVHVSVPETAAPLVKVGADVTFTLPSLHGQTFKVTRMSRMLDERTRTMLVEIVIENKDDALLPGMYGEATITLKQKQQALMLPARAVRFDKKGVASLYLLNSDDTVRIVPVKTGIDHGDEIEITDGLKAGDRVVGPIIGRLQPKQKVRVR